jgi:hypothetical protein
MFHRQMLNFVAELFHIPSDSSASPKMFGRGDNEKRGLRIYYSINLFLLFEY